MTDGTITPEVRIKELEEALATECECLAPPVSQHRAVATVGGGAWANIATVVGTQRGSSTRLRLFELEMALALVQTQASTMSMSKVWLLAESSPAHQGLWGLVRSARVEASLPVQQRFHVVAPAATGAAGTAAGSATYRLPSRPRFLGFVSVNRLAHLFG